MRMRPMVAVIAGFLVFAAPAGADDVHLNDGRVLDGEVISAPDEDPIRLRRGSGTLVVVQHIPRDQVANVVLGTNQRQRDIAAIQAERAELAARPDGGDAVAWWTLAERAREAGDPGLARELAVEVVARDRGHVEARRSLGMAQVRGVWMRANEAAVATGQVLHQGRWMTWDERQASVELRERRAEQAVARREAAAERRAARAEARSSSQLPYGAINVPAYGYGAYDYGWRQPTVITWPGCGVGGSYSNHGNSGLTVAGAGSSGSSSWAFRWNW